MADQSYCGKIAKYYGQAGGNAFPAPGSNGPAQMLFDNHQTYQHANNSPVVEGSDSWPGSANPTTAKVIR
jgi:hypothetical protein